ncbi:MAG: hypothetical protein BWY89_01696 [Bacteroidetes bacterium ADurb.BinA012]|nr:MAG: hypothetical protein BWY89_01696 [Bacteroidetes bacterium ADurb.BinA012]
MPFNNLHGKVFGSDEGGNIYLPELSPVILVCDLALHNPLTYGGHLWPVVRIDDGGNNVTAKSRPDLIEQVFIRGIGLADIMVAYLKAGAVGCQPAVQE